MGPQAIAPPHHQSRGAPAYLSPEVLANEGLVPEHFAGDDSKMNTGPLGGPSKSLTKMALLATQQ